MCSNFTFYNVKDEYINYLREIESRVMLNKQELHCRPYVGFVLNVNEKDYLVPLSSQILKTSKVTMVIPNTFTQVQLANSELMSELPEKISTIKFNNMIPVYPEVIEKINISKLNQTPRDLQYKDLLLKEILFCNDGENKNRIIKKANETYAIKTNPKPKTYLKEIIDSCCDFKKLEDQMDRYRDMAKRDCHLTI